MSNLILSCTVLKNRTFEVRKGDLTDEDSEAIVNAANVALKHGGGVAAAIVRKGGASIQKESEEYVLKHGALQTGQVAATRAGRLKCKIVIHAVGPIWRGGNFNEEESLEEAIRNCLTKASEMKLNSISIPAISSGIFGFPKTLCSQILIGACIDFFNEFPSSSILVVRFTNIDQATVSIFETTLRELTPLEGV